MSAAGSLIVMKAAPALSVTVPGSDGTKRWIWLQTCVSSPSRARRAATVRFSTATGMLVESARRCSTARPPSTTRTSYSGNRYRVVVYARSVRLHPADSAAVHAQNGACIERGIGSDAVVAGRDARNRLLTTWLAFKGDRRAIQRHVGPTPRRLRGGPSRTRAFGTCQPTPSTQGTRAGGKR